MGYRDGSTVVDVGDGCSYWSFTSHGTYWQYVQRVYFSENLFDPLYYTSRRYGQSVRLAKSATE
ncbi:MAG: hypothetical protein IJ776_08520 [Paludibacteraceae bacterium]|nr:hypothetical protein [Paludibacteraceae bacterium]